MASQPLFPASDRLSQELLVMIVEHVKTHPKGGVEDLKNMRLATPRFAYLGKLLSYLFNTVRFEANPDRSDSLASMDWSTLGSYVQCVIFDPGEYSWAMTWEVFASVVKKRTLRNCVADTRPLELLIASTDQLIAQHYPKDSPGEETKLQRRYQDYMSRSEDVRQMYESGHFRGVWAQCLRSLPHVTDFLLGWCDYGGQDPLNDVEMGFNARGHSPSLLWNQHQTAQCVTGEALMKTAFQVIGDVNIKARCLFIECALTNDFSWATDGSLADVDFSCLQALRFDPKLEKHGSDWSTERKEASNRSCAAALSEILKRCSQSLKCLEAYQGTDAGFPMDDTPVMHSLKSFAISGALRLQEMAEFITQARLLEDVCFSVSTGMEGSWRDVMRAIRYHHKRMAVNFDRLCVFREDHEYFTLNHHSGSEFFELAPAHLGRSRAWAANVSVANYIANKAKWDAACRIRIEGPRPELGAVSDEDDLDSPDGSDAAEEDGH